ncbi:MAG TPA: hypothetical protein VGB31_02760 [Myxococcota bacterium]
MSTTKCASGSSRLQIFDVAAGTILFGDDRLFRVPLSCSGRPTVVFTPEYRGLHGPVANAFIARDGRRVAATIAGQAWLGTLAGSSWGKVGDYEVLGWADADRIAVSPRDGIREPFAVDVTGARGQKGEISFWKHPERVRGNHSPDGNRVLYEIVDRSKPPSIPVTRSRAAFEVRAGQPPPLTWPIRTLVYDRVTAQEHELDTRIDLTGGIDRTPSPAKVNPTSVWNDSAELLVHVQYSHATRQSSVGLLTADGTGRGLFSLDWEAWRAGWLDGARLWVAGSAGTVVLDPATGVETPLDLPGQVSDIGSVDLVDWEENRTGASE